MQYDIQLDIATGTSRTQKKWKNQKWMWSDLVDKLADTVRTPETIQEYLTKPKSEQDSIKDVGGFVGGYLMNGSRTAVKHRQVICLDIDFGSEDLWDMWALLQGKAAVMYSTHKHRKDSPRLRLIVPLDRRVSCEEYEAIARKIAEGLDIEAFDDTTYQPQRLMYWPSTSKDGDYVFKFLDAEILNADSVLNEYVDWKDITAWPTSSRTQEVIARAIKKQQDPLEKEGAIGAFCRAYSIQEAIEVFVDDYEPCAIDGRYTYTKGSTGAGVVIYDDKFSYSHHSTDPASMQLCNAFDLVRIHKFGELDEECKIDTPVNRRPSFKEMQNFVYNDDKVKVQKFKDTTEDFTDLSVGDKGGSDEVDLEWVKGLEMDQRGAYVANAHNLELILENDPEFKNVLGYNELARTIEARRNLPWRRVGAKDRQVNDNDDAQFRSLFSKRYGIEGKDKIFDAVNIVAHKHKFHPIKDYLEKLQWDGVRRLENVFIDCFNCDDNEYVRAVTRKTLVAAVARVYEPGIKFDYMLTLYGVQGKGKSTFFNRLSKGFFTDKLPQITSKDAMEHLQGVWIVEMAEMAPMKKADELTIKSFITSTCDRFRMSYGRRTVDYPRQCIFVGTTNEHAILKDYTGNRRFWIIASRKGQPKRDPLLMQEWEIDQLWAEAKHIYDNGKETLYLDERLEAMADEQREDFMMEDPREGVIREYLDRKITADWYCMDKWERRTFIQEGTKGSVYRQKVCALEIWVEALGKKEDAINRHEASEINKILERIEGWERAGAVRINGYGVQKGFRRL